MRSTSAPVGRPSRRTFPLFAIATLTLAGLGACGTSPDVQESPGPVETWPGTPDPATVGLTTQAVTDDTANRATSETHALITSASGYADYFGHAPPSGLDFRREWVIFYAAGTKPTGGYKAEVQSIGVKGDTLYAVTVLQSPGLCPVTQGLTSPSVLVKFPAQRTRGVIFQHHEAVALCGPPATCETLGCKPGYHCEALTINPPRVECVANPMPTSPCAAILCGPGQQCVVLDSNPPQAKCAPIAPIDPVSCISSNQCKDGLVCSTEQGVCGANPSCPTMSACDAACWGTCVKKADPSPVRCTSSQSCAAGLRCSTERGDCLSCRDPQAGTAFAACPAVCFGVCEPAPVSACTTGILKGNCRAADVLKAAAAAACQAQMLVLTDFGIGQACFASGFVDAKYSCCPVR
jgi:PrcB C-terminal